MMVQTKFSVAAALLDFLAKVPADDDQDGYESITWTVWHFSPSSYFARTNSKGCPRRLFMHSKVKNMVSWHFLTMTLHINTLHKVPPLDGC